MNFLMARSLISVLMLIGLAATPAIAAGKDPDVSGMVMEFAERHPALWERFETDGRWSTVVNMRARLALGGSWQQQGSRICVSITTSSFESLLVGQVVCRDIKRMDGALRFRPVTGDGTQEITLRPIKP